MKFQLTKSDNTTNARAAKLITDHGVIKTPIFMPVGTLGTVKGIHNKELQNLYFDDELSKKSIQDIKLIDKSSNKIEIKNFKFINE